jgi:uncharacterized protein YjbJ (UPF0337 family)
MNWDRIQDNWGEFRVAAKQRWAKLGESQLKAIGGRRELLARRIVETYGISAQETEDQLREWQGQLTAQRPNPR